MQQLTIGQRFTVNGTEFLFEAADLYNVMLRNTKTARITIYGRRAFEITMRQLGYEVKYQN
jgi:hypothetical protein